MASVVIPWLAWNVDLRLDVGCWISDDWKVYPFVKLLNV